MPTSRRKGMGAALALLSAVALTAWACGDTTAADPTPVQTWKITPASDSTPPPEETAAPSSPTAPVESTPGAGAVIQVVGVGNVFDVEEIEVEAGPVTVEFDNQDAGIVHNIHFYEGDDDEGESVAESELEVGPVVQTLTFDVTAGEYFYQCDAHPTTMTGSMSVN